MMQDEAGASSGAVTQPFSDLFLGLSAAMMVMLIVLAPAATRLAKSEPVADPAIETDTIIAPAALPATGQLLIARPGGLLVQSREASEDIALDAILDDPRLARFAAGRLASATPAMLLVQPGSGETVFLTESRLSALGLRSVQRVALDAECQTVVDIRPDNITCSDQAAEE